MATELRSYCLGACWLKAHITLNLDMKSRECDNPLDAWTKAGEKNHKGVENNNIWLLNGIEFSFIITRISWQMENTASLC